MEHRPPLSGRLERGGACEGRGVLYHPGRIHPLAAVGGKGAGRGRGLRHVPNRFRDL